MEKEIWKTIEGYENYMVSNLGRVKSLRFGKEKILKQTITNQNYCLVGLCKEGKTKTFRVHKLVARAFIPNPQNLPQLNHKDEVKTNNCVDNLEWCTAKYNSNYGTRNERCSKTMKGMKRTQETKDKISKAKSKPILQFNREGTKILGKFNSVTQASKKLNINRGNICSCCNGKLKITGNYRWMFLEDYVNRMEKLYQMALKNVS